MAENKVTPVQFHSGLEAPPLLSMAAVLFCAAVRELAMGKTE